jgi:Ca-activated chloride channel family protein
LPYMLSFHRPESLWALLLLPVLVLLWIGWQRWQRRVLRQWRGVQKSPARKWGFATLLLPLLAVALIVVAWAGPFNPKVSEQKPASGVDVMVALDCSKSMRATDLKPDRLNRAISLINRLATLRPGDRMGLLVFAGRAYHSVPLTTDRTVLRMGLESATPESLPTQGTVLSEAIRSGATAFSPDQRRAKVLLLLTDGEDHDAGAPDAATAAQEEGIHLFAVGVGSPAGTTLTEADGTLKTDAGGNPVITRLGEESLRALVTGHGGKYWRLESTGGTATAIADALGPLPSTPVLLPADAEGYEYFPLLAGSALLILLLQMLPPLFRRRKPVLALVFLLAGIPALSNAQTAWQEGDKLYRSGKFSEAAAAYKKALSDTAAQRAAGYNLGNALYRAGKFEEAQKAYEGAKGRGKTGRAAYNEGNSWAEQKKWKEAMEAYKEALRREPRAQDAQYNYNYARAQQQAQEAQEQEKKKEQPKPSQPEKEDPKGEPKKPEPQPSKLTKEEADRLLKSLQREEEKTGERRKGQPSQDANPEKDW